MFQNETGRNFNMKRTRSQAGRMARHKGDNYERYIAKLLTEKLGIEVKRRGFETGKGRVKPPDLEFPQSYSRFDSTIDPNTGQWILNGGIECKKVQSWSIDNLIKGKGELSNWIEEYTTKYGSTEKFILIFSKNHYPDMVLIDNNNIADYYFDWQIYFKLVTEDKGVTGLTILKLDEFLNNVEKEFFNINHEKIKNINNSNDIILPFYQEGPPHSSCPLEKKY